MVGMKRRYELVPERSVAAYFAGAFVGAAITAFMVTIGMGAAPDFTWRLGEILFIASLAFFVAAIAWTVGGFLALPLWFILDRAGLTGPRTASLSGIALVTTAFMLSGVFGALNGLVVGAVSGAAAGLALWRVAYRRSDAGADPS